ncbi:MAG: hypothetical protein ACOH5I_13730 [Oligoflexus sp.]
MPKGSQDKREREYKKLKYKFENAERYPGREEEVAARIVNKQRSEYGETKKTKEKRQQNKNTDKDLPIKNYQTLTVPEVVKKIGKMNKQQILQIKKYERKHKDRKTLIEQLNRHAAAS